MAVQRRDAPTPQDSPPAASGGGLDVWTLVITALASAGAALVSSELLGSGTLISAALTPVVIALLKEALDRPRRVVSTVVPAAVPRPRRPRSPGAPASRAADLPLDVEPAAPRQGDAGQVRIYRSTGRRWRLALVTGLLGFVLAAAVLTATELAAGGAVAGSRATTYFGGGDGADRGSEREEDPQELREPAPAAPETPDPSATTPEAPVTPAAPEDGEEVPPATAPAPQAPAQPAPGPGAPVPAPAPEAAPGAPAAPAP